MLIYRVAIALKRRDLGLQRGQGIIHRNQLALEILVDDLGLDGQMTAFGPIDLDIFTVQVPSQRQTDGQNSDKK